MVESYIGAIFVDSGFNFRVVEDFYEKHIKPYFEDMELYDTFANKHPTVSIRLLKAHPERVILTRLPDISA